MSIRRHIGVILLLAGLIALLVACDSSGLGLPTSSTPQPTITTAAQATYTLPSVAEVTSTSQPTVPLSTATAGSTGDVTPGTAVPQGTSEADAEVAQIEANAEKIRGLTAKNDVPETFINKDQMRANITKLFEEDYSREEAKDEATLLWLFRLIDDPKLDLYQLQIDLHSDVVLGYYDPKVKDLFVLQQGDKLSAEGRSTVAHEFVHSLQDQYFDLDKLLPDKSYEYDRDTAVRALVEGDAVASEVAYVRKYFTPAQVQELIQEESSAPTTTLDNAPRYIKDTLYFPYIQSQPFLDALMAQNGFVSVNKALADPPQSTEQVLHPEKYLDSPRDEPIKVTVPPLTSTLTTLSPGWKYVDGGSWGEFDDQLLLKVNGVDDSEADQAAAGWGGAWYVQYVNGDNSVLAVDSQWDTTTDADEFIAAMGKSFGVDTKDGDLWVNGGRYFSVTQNDKRVLYIASTDKATLEAVLAQLK